MAVAERLVRNSLSSDSMRLIDGTPTLRGTTMAPKYTFRPRNRTADYRGHAQCSPSSLRQARTRPSLIKTSKFRTIMS